MTQIYAYEPTLVRLWPPILFLVFFPILLWQHTQLKFSMLSFNQLQFNFKGKLSTAYWLITGKILICFTVYLILLLILMSQDKFLISFAIVQHNRINIAGAILAFIFGFIVITILQSIAWGIFLAGIEKYKNSDIYLGQQQIHFSLKQISTFRFAAFAYLLFFILFVAFGFFKKNYIPFQLIMLNAINSNTHQIFGLIYFISIMLILIAISVTYYQFRMHKNLSNGFSFLNLTTESTLKAFPLLWINVSNYLMIAATLGLAIPIAQIRSRRYFAENTHIIGGIDLQAIAESNTQTKVETQNS